MAKKGEAKNTRNKALHSKLIKQKKNKKRSALELRKARLKAIIQKSKEEE